MRARMVVFWVAVVAVLAPAALLTFTRVVEPSGGFWIRLEAFTPLAIVLYGAALAVLVIRVLVERRWRSAVPFVAVVVAVGLAAHCWWFAPQVTGANPPPEQGADPLTVMTANLLRGEGDGIDVVRTASEEHVDLLVVQEITAADLADMERAGVGDLLPYRVGEPNGAVRGTMVFSRAALGAAQRVPTRNDSWIVTMGDLVVMALHPSAPTSPDSWRHDHATIARAVDDVDPDLVVGDFNATADHAPMRRLADAGYRDVGELANQGWQPTWPANGVVDLLGLPLPSVAQIDHVLVGSRMAAVSMRTAAIPGSDHRAVVAEVARK
jgi:endonuclease/exonuclease/phosphatase (EEP) superfamily protein YafD